MTSHSIKAVTFDFWNTIVVEVAVQFQTRRAEMMSELLAKEGLRFDPLAAEAALREAWLIWCQKWQQPRLPVRRSEPARSLRKRVSREWFPMAFETASAVS